MTTDQLKINMDDMATAQTQVQSIFDILDNSQLFKDDTANAVGNERLRAKVIEFSDNWNDRRDDVIERLQYVKDTLGKIADQFNALDGELATALTNPAPAPAGPPTNSGMA